MCESYDLKLESLRSTGLGSVSGIQGFTVSNQI